MEENKGGEQQSKGGRKGGKGQVESDYQITPTLSRGIIMGYDSEVVVGRLVWPALKCRNEGKEMPNKSEGLPIEHSRK